MEKAISNIVGCYAYLRQDSGKPKVDDGLLNKTWKSFHFRENNLLISFPSEGNERKKYLYYKVQIKKSGSKDTKEACLGEILGAREFEEGYPYTVGFFKGQIKEAYSSDYAYLEIRVVRCLEDFWKFLNDLNI